LLVGITAGFVTRDCVAACGKALLGGAAASLGAEWSIGSRIAVGAQFNAWLRPVFIFFADPTSIQRLKALAATARYLPSSTAPVALRVGAGPIWYRAQGGDVHANGLAVQSGVEYSRRGIVNATSALFLNYLGVVTGTVKARDPTSAAETARARPFRAGLIEVGVSLRL
jgi:hypothetical protein